jgi:ankyrin repeat protein
MTMKMPENKEDISIKPANSNLMKHHSDSLVEKSIEYLKALESESFVDVEELDLKGWNLHRAAEENRADIARALINSGNDVNTRDDSEATPLFPAAFSNSIQVAKVLIDNGADVNALDSGSWSPLLLASHFDSVEFVMLMILNGANIEAKDGDGYSSLFYASQQHSLKLATFLIQHGANTDGIDLSWMDRDNSR